VVESVLSVRGKPQSTHDCAKQLQTHTLIWLVLYLLWCEALEKDRSLCNSGSNEMMLNLKCEELGPQQTPCSLKEYERPKMS